MAKNYHCLWLVAFNYGCSWVDVDGDSKIMAGLGLHIGGCGCLWVVVAKIWLVVGGCEWFWMVT